MSVKCSFYDETFYRFFMQIRWIKKMMIMCSMFWQRFYKFIVLNHWGKFFPQMISWKSSSTSSFFFQSWDWDMLMLCVVNPLSFFSLDPLFNLKLCILLMHSYFQLRCTGIFNWTGRNWNSLQESTGSCETSDRWFDSTPTLRRSSTIGTNAGFRTS